MTAAYILGELDMAGYIKRLKDCIHGWNERMKSCRHSTIKLPNNAGKM